MVSAQIYLFATLEFASVLKAEFCIIYKYSLIISYGHNKSYREAWVTVGALFNILIANWVKTTLPLFPNGC